VKRDFRHARDYLNALAAGGRYSVTSREVQAALAVSPAAAKLALNRLAKQKVVASPARGFYVIVPPEYQSMSCLPAEHFIPALMEHLDLSYYAGLLSAAEYHGAAHQRPQVFQVMVARNRRPIHCGKVRVAFIARKRVADVQIQSFNTPRGAVLVSTPETTALDLVGYAAHVGGLNQVASVLSELAERIDVGKLAAAAETAPVPWAQRLGFLLEHLGFGVQASALKEYVRQRARQWALLSPRSSRKRSHRNKSWRLHINIKVESEGPGGA
jgi:predicted transcriptional regulator of viral defense system